MRVAVIVVLVLVRATPSEASTSCVTKTEARQHFGAVQIYWHGGEHCWDATPTRRRHQIHKVQQKILRRLLNIFDRVVEKLLGENSRRDGNGRIGSSGSPELFLIRDLGTAA